MGEDCNQAFLRGYDKGYDRGYRRGWNKGMEEAMMILIAVMAGFEPAEIARDLGIAWT